MKIIYHGPQDKVNVAPYGEHFKGQVKEYPDPFGRELLETSRRQQFEALVHQHGPAPKLDDTLERGEAGFVPEEKAEAEVEAEAKAEKEKAKAEVEIEKEKPKPKPKSKKKK
jgi:hypothetical protein